MYTSGAAIEVREVTLSDPPDRPLVTVTYDGDDPLGHMLALNSHRRHDSESQRALGRASGANAASERRFAR